MSGFHLDEHIVHVAAQIEFTPELMLLPFAFLFISVLVYTSSLLEFAFSDDHILSHPGLLTKP